MLLGATLNPLHWKRCLVSSLVEEKDTLCDVAHSASSPSHFFPIFYLFYQPMVHYSIYDGTVLQKKLMSLSFCTYFSLLAFSFLRWNSLFCAHCCRGGRWDKGAMELATVKPRPLATDSLKMESQTEKQKGWPQMQSINEKSASQASRSSDWKSNRTRQHSHGRVCRKCRGAHDGYNCQLDRIQNHPGN